MDRDSPQTPWQKELTTGRPSRAEEETGGACFKGLLQVKGLLEGVGNLGMQVGVHTVCIVGYTHLVQVVVENTGYLPSYGSHRSLMLKAVRDLVAEIDLPEGASLLQGKLRAEMGQLEGRAGKPPITLGGFSADNTDDRVKLEWVIKGAGGKEVSVTARHDKAGTVRTTLSCD